MPAVNQSVLASVGIVAASMAVAAAIAIYESPEFRRMAEDFRRRIAIALHSLGDNVEPHREPRFNRPEDAEGFLQSRGVVGADAGVEADEESRRRQREELMYWNAQKQERERKDEEKRDDGPPAKVTFDDFMRQDGSAEKGAFVYNTGAQITPNDDAVVRRRGLVGVQGLNASVYAKPFADENASDYEEHPGVEVEPNALSPGRDEIMSDIYDASPRIREQSRTLSPDIVPVATLPEVLFDFSEEQAPEPARPESPATINTAATFDGRSEYMSAVEDDVGQHDPADVYAAVQAWAEGSKAGIFSPMPDTPDAPMSEPELISDGALTPTGSGSVAGSGVDLGDAVSSRAVDGSDYDAMSEDGFMATPNSWSEVGSQVSESDDHMHA